MRAVFRDGEPWWVLNDICALLEIANPNDAARRLRDWQKDGVGITDPIGRQQITTVVNEAGIYKLVLNSRKPVAEEFERWLTCEVLPSIRKHGSYPPPSATIALPPVEGEWDGLQKTVGERFKEERMRWEAETGDLLMNTPHFSAKVIRAIEDDLGGTRNKGRIEYLTYANFDVRYVLTGHRSLTAGERFLRDAYRSAAPSDQRALLEWAASLPPVEKPVGLLEN